MSHKGSLLLLPSGIYAWPVSSADEITLNALERVLSEKDKISFLLLGTGEHQIFPAPEIVTAFEKAGLGLDPMSTSAACRTYNVLLAEDRPVAASLIAVD